MPPAPRPPRIAVPDGNERHRPQPMQFRTVERGRGTLQGGERLLHVVKGLARVTGPQQRVGEQAQVVRLFE